MTDYWFARSAKLPLFADVDWRKVNWRRVRVEVRVGLRSGMVPLPISVPGHLLLWTAIVAMAAGGVVALIFGRQMPEETGLLLLVWLVVIGIPAGLVMNQHCDPQRTLEDYASARKAEMDTAR